MAHRQKAKRKPLKLLLSIISKIQNLNLSKLVRFIQLCVTKINQYFQFIKKYLDKHKRFFIVLLVFLVCSIITSAAILPGNHIFEGNLIAQEINFTYNGQQPKVFIQNIRNIKELENEGIQTLTFTGSFQSQNLPAINNLDSVKIQLKDSDSRWIITPVNPKATSTIELTKLRLEPGTKINELNYDFQRQQLAFDLQPNPNSNPNTLELYLGEEPLKVILEGYKLPGIKLPNEFDEQAPLEFIVNPNNKEFLLQIQNNTSIHITLNKSPKDNIPQWFRGKLDTKDVKFLYVDRNANDSREDLYISAIVEGKIRMAGQEQEIKQNQFLMGENPNKPLNIQLIRHLQIIPNKGIEARFSGRTTKIQIGLDQDFPVSKIQGSWLDGVLPRDAIIALFSAGAATVANLLAWLFSNASNSGSNNNQP
ncbi:hypothetical protein ACX27_12540 [Nostoc piscinale CENA21]|uniref:Uncharacterized protein n=1 Tax=Nostoc piscinale CENA21 TaxID=224013 RepID=A0A0M4T433_9NOSO|nr:hypothetical protein [Nostoc piscinale]ALF53479.1 hypothetical protein ACX27_12540 [Nostoc piscinale CENA21]